MFIFFTFDSCFEKGAFFKLQNFTLISNDKSQSSVLDRAGVCLVPEDSVCALLRNPSICYREASTYSGSSFSSISFFLSFFITHLSSRIFFTWLLLVSFHRIPKVRGVHLWWVRRSILLRFLRPTRDEYQW